MPVVVYETDVGLALNRHLAAVYARHRQLDAKLLVGRTMLTIALEGVDPRSAQNATLAARMQERCWPRVQAALRQRFPEEAVLRQSDAGLRPFVDAQLASLLQEMRQALPALCLSVLQQAAADDEGPALDRRAAADRSDAEAAAQMLGVTIKVCRAETVALAAVLGDLMAAQDGSTAALEAATAQILASIDRLNAAVSAAEAWESRLAGVQPGAISADPC